MKETCEWMYESTIIVAQPSISELLEASCPYWNTENLSGQTTKYSANEAI